MRLEIITSVILGLCFGILASGSLGTAAVGTAVMLTTVGVASLGQWVRPSSNAVSASCDAVVVAAFVCLAAERGAVWVVGPMSSSEWITREPSLIFPRLGSFGYLTLLASLVLGPWVARRSSRSRYSPATVPILPFCIALLTWPIWRFEARTPAPDGTVCDLGAGIPTRLALLTEPTLSPFAACVDCRPVVGGQVVASYARLL